MMRTVNLAAAHALVSLALLAVVGPPLRPAEPRGGGEGAPPHLAAATSPPTFNRDVAPILFANCAECHHPEGSAPFSLLSYPEVKKRAGQIAAVTRSHFMPPWLPEAGDVEIAGARRLTDAQIETIAQWAQHGAVEGKRSDLPPAPHFNQGWQLGQPDLVLKMARPYLLPAGSADIFRNFVIPVNVDRPRYVRALEILPGNPKLIHHANVLIDRTGASRRLDGKDGEPGFPGMDIEMESETFEPDSHFLFWKPGTPPVAEPADMAWRVDRNTDLVLNMHLQPTGKPERVEATLGLYFTDTPPTKFPMLLQLEHDGALDIPPGARDFLVTDDFTLPVDVRLLAIYPHAHYLGKRLEAFATLPAGTKQTLIRIPDWDLNWQAVYPYAHPPALPRGTVISMRYTYDNSEANVRNPNHPPKRVVGGNNATDEMAHLWLQVLPASRDDLLVLQEAVMEQRLRKYPADFVAHFNLGALRQREGRLDEAIAQFAQALRARPDDARALNNLGAALQAQGRLDTAVKAFRQALAARPDYTDAHYNLGHALLALEQPREAAEHFHAVLQASPDDAGAHNGLGSALVMRNDLAGARAQFSEAVRLRPGFADAEYNLGYVLSREGQLDPAAEHLTRALAAHPDDADTLNELGAVDLRRGKRAEAIAEFEHALRVDPTHAEARANLARARAAR